MSWLLRRDLPPTTTIIRALRKIGDTYVESNNVNIVVDNFTTNEVGGKEMKIISNLRTLPASEHVMGLSSYLTPSPALLT